MNKRGQFYLIAALVIVSITAGFIVITNKASSIQNPSATYLKGELSTESSYIISYGISNGLSNSEIEAMLANLSEDYINNTPESNLYFIIGTTQSITFIAYQTSPDSVVINGATENTGTGTIYTQTFSSPGNSIDIKINDTSYKFELNQGENFHFVIDSLTSGQEYATSG